MKNKAAQNNQPRRVATQSTRAGLLTSARRGFRPSNRLKLQRQLPKGRRDVAVPLGLLHQSKTMFAHRSETQTTLAIWSASRRVLSRQSKCKKTRKSSMITSMMNYCLNLSSDMLTKMTNLVVTLSAWSCQTIIKLHQQVPQIGHENTLVIVPCPCARNLVNTSSIEGKSAELLPMCHTTHETCSLMIIASNASINFKAERSTLLYQTKITIWCLKNQATNWKPRTFCRVLLDSSRWTRRRRPSLTPGDRSLRHSDSCHRSDQAPLQSTKMKKTRVTST